MKHSEQINELGSALVKAQLLISGATKDGTNPHFKSNFATLQSCIEASRPALTENGLSVIQGAETNEHGGISLTTMLLHTSGQWVQASLEMTPDPVTMKRNASQALGSALSYARRYGYSSLVGLYQTDDDGESAGSNGNGEVRTHGLTKPTITTVPENTVLEQLPRNLAKSPRVMQWVQRFEEKFPTRLDMLLVLGESNPTVEKFLDKVTQLAKAIKADEDYQPTPPSEVE